MSYLSGLCDGTIAWTICRSVCLSTKCIVAKRLSGSGCRWDGMGVLDGVVIVEGEGTVLV